jgi:alkylhydroperoxidase family enzyme
LDRALLHSFPIAEGWSTFFSAINNRTDLAEDLREIAICRVALICRARVQWNGHVATLRKLVDNEQLRAISTRNLTSQGVLTNVQWAVLRYADAMTTDLVVEDALFSELKAAELSEQAIVELTTAVAAYNCVSRFLIALEVDEKIG